VPNYFRLYSPIYTDLQTDSTTPAERTSIEGLDFEDRALAPLTIISATYLDMNDVSFYANWVADYYGTSQLQFNAALQANSFLLLGFVGDLTIYESEFRSHRGFTPTYIYLERTAYGFATKLLNWQKCSFDSFTMTKTIF
jgi:hypothetical protein